MFPITNKLLLANNIKRIDISAPNIARKIQPGQFVAVCPQEGDERIPLAVVESDFVRGTITIVVNEIGPTTKKLGNIAIKEPIFSILGPLGCPSAIDKKGNVICIMTGMGAAQALPICRALKKAGNKIIGIMGAKTKRSLFLEAQMRIVCSKLFIATEDGSYERRGLATDTFKKTLTEQAVNAVYAFGSPEMMESICRLTQEKKIETRVHLNPRMVDCMGMCGSCRIKVDGQMVLACIDGPEFDGHRVDFKDFKIRLNALEKEDEWLKRKIESKPQRRESIPLPRFLLGYLKK